jgi:ankyrin repeat protein
MNMTAVRSLLFPAAFAAVFSAALVVTYASVPSPIADAAERGDTVAVEDLIRRHTDVNAAQADGMTALHWSALNGDVKTLDALLAAKAATDPVTRLGGYTPLHLASKRGQAAAVTRLLDAGSNATAVTSTGVQPIHLAAEAGSADAIVALLAHGADVNVKDTTHGRTPLIFATSEHRIDAMKALIAKGADVRATTTVIDYMARASADNAERSARDRAMRDANPRAAASPANSSIPNNTSGLAAGRGQGGFTPDPNDPDPSAAFTGRGRGTGNGPRPPSDIEAIGKQGGFTALHYAVRDGFADAVAVLLDANADVNTPTNGDRSTPLVVAAINGQYDIAMTLLSRGANPNLANDDGVAPLFATVNNEWALRTWYPQPTAGTQQKASYLELIESMLKAGADPNARTLSHIWYASYNTGRMGVDFAGATPFWRAAYALDVEAMRLLVRYGADPNIATMTFGVAKRPTDQSGLPAAPPGSQHVPPFHAASGVGYGTSRVAQQHRHVPDGWMPAAKYFLEELGVDVNIRDADGFTALHLAAARGDNEMIKYLVSKGANVMAVNRAGQTTVDMANSPEQRTQPFPETIKLLESMGAKNNHRCQACK